MGSFLFLACVPAGIIFILLIRKSTSNWPFKLIGALLLGFLILLLAVLIFYIWNGV